MKLSMFRLAATAPALMVGVLSHPVFAQQAAAPTVNFEACYWQDALNATLCDHTMSVGIGVVDRNVIWKDQRIMSVPRDRFFVETNSETHYNWLDAAGAIAITPLPWLKITATSQYEDFSDVYAYSTIQSGGHFGPDSGRTKTGSDDWLWQTLTANAKIYDSGPGDARYFAHVFANLGFIPGQDDIPAQSRIGAGGEAGARWALSPSYAVNAKALVEFDHFSYTLTH